MRASADEPGSLADLERWFQNEVVGPQERGTRSKLEARRDHAKPARSISARREILPAAHLTPSERVAIYSRMYFLRMRDALLADFPTVARLAGDENFDRIVRAYVTRHPSRHYSLNHLGAELPGFFAGPVRIPKRALLADVARLELAMSEVFDAERSTVMTPADFARVHPEVWATARPRLITALRVLAFEHRANAIVTAVRKDESLPVLVKKKTWTVVYRKDDVVWRMEVSEPMHAALRVLRAGGTLESAISAAASSFRGTPEELQAQIFGWFGEWASEGFFSAIEA